jgi:hypothetical protein
VAIVFMRDCAAECTYLAFDGASLMISATAADPMPGERGDALVVYPKEQTALSTPRWGKSTKCAFARTLVGLAARSIATAGA